MDPLGHQLLRERLSAIPRYLAETAAAVAPRPTLLERPKRIITTGIGSSEAHARSLVGLLNRRGGPPAHFVPIASFLDGLPCPDAHLVLFSQGLSANVQIALRMRRAFAGLTLFTSATDAGLKAAGRHERAKLLATLRDEGAEIVTFPVDQEYEILIRVVGPACGFLAGRIWAGALLEKPLPPITPNDARAVWNQGLQSAPTEAFARCKEAMAAGFILLASPLLDGAINSACKFVEGAFWPAPQVVDPLSFAHGPFQQLAASPRPVLMVFSNSTPEIELANRAADMCAAIGAAVLQTPLSACPTLAALEAEAALNPVLLMLCETLGVNQREWPGKGLDGRLYGFLG